MASALRLYNYRIMLMMMDTKVEEGSQVTTNLPETTKNLPEIPEGTNSNCCKKFSRETLERILLVSFTVNIILLLHLVFSQNWIGNIWAAIRGKQWLKLESSD